LAAGTIEILTGRERRRRWSLADKLRMVAESGEAGARVADVAARHDICPNLLHGWRRLAREGRLRAPDTPDFVPVRLTSPPTDTPLVALSPTSMRGGRDAPAMEIVLASGERILIRQSPSAPLLRAVITALRG
jgi:transposase